MNSTKILIVEDEVLIAEYIFELLIDESFHLVKIAHSKEDAILLMNEFEPDVILMDINLHGIYTGIELANQKNQNAAVIFLTGQYDFDLLSKALETNPEYYLTKPIKKNDLFAAIQLAVLKNELKTITINDGINVVKVKLDTILFVKSDSNYIDIITKNKKILYSYGIRCFFK